MALARLIPFVDWLARHPPYMDGIFAQNIFPEQKCIRGP